jgi:2,3-bisphosphoglycerate-independent phosphoglycerate mutase
MKEENKILMIVCDGIGDRPVPELNYSTPLQVADTPHFDRIAANSACGIMDAIAPGIRPGSDTAHLALLGYDPYAVYTGRGPIEAAGINMELQAGDVALRCNFGTVNDKFIVIDRRAGRIKEGTAELAEVIDGIEIDDVKIFYKPATEHRGVLVLRGDNLSAEVTDIDPHKENLRIHEAVARPDATDHDSATRTATIINKVVREAYMRFSVHEVNKARARAGELPANIILPRGAGIFKPIPSFSELHQGLKSIAIVGVSLIKGICRIAQMAVPEIAGATGGVDTDMIAKADAALKALDTYEFVFVNVKAPDIYGHDGDAKGKIKCIMQLDDMLAKINRELPEGTCMVVCADHSTPVTVKGHSADPVPLAICSKSVRVDNVTKYDELSMATGGSLGRLRGRDLIPILLDLIDRTEKFGA